MKKHNLLSIAALLNAVLWCAGARADLPHLTGITVYSLNAFTLYDGVNGWDTVPTNARPNVWVVTGGLYYDNGPSDAEAGIDIPLGTGSGPMWIYCSPGDIFEPYHGINLFFNHSTLPQISGYEATACAGGPAKAYLGDSLGLSGTVPAAGTVRAVVDGYEILLETFLLARPDCGSGDTDLVAPFSKTPDGTTDFGGVFMLTVTPVPLLSIARTTTNTVVLWWPSHPTGWALQENTNSVSSVNWSNVLATPLDDGSHKIIIVDPPTGNRFYRLFKP